MSNKIFFTVGPTELFSEVRKLYSDALDKKIFSLSHRSNEFSEIFKNTVKNLKKLLDIPEGFYIFFLSSATECMERIIQNLVFNKSFHYVNGFFAERFYNISIAYNKSPEKIVLPYGKGTNFEKVQIPKSTDLVCIILNETSTGVALNINDIIELKKNNSNILFALDIVTAVPYYKLDYQYVDCAFFSVQKGFGMPPGLGVLIVNEKCIKKAEELNKNGISIGSFNNFIKLKENFLKNQTPVTPNIPAIYTLGKICELLILKGYEKIKQETDKKAEIIYNYFENQSYIKPFVKEKHYQSKTTIVLESMIESEKICKEITKRGFIISKGYNVFKDQHIRIGNFPMHKIEDVINLIDNFELIKLKNK